MSSRAVVAADALDLDALLLEHLRKRAPGLSEETLRAAFATPPPLSGQPPSSLETLLGNIRVAHAETPAGSPPASPLPDWVDNERAKKGPRCEPARPVPPFISSALSSLPAAASGASAASPAGAAAAPEVPKLSLHGAAAAVGQGQPGSGDGSGDGAGMSAVQPPAPSAHDAVANAAAAAAAAAEQPTPRVQPASESAAEEASPTASAGVPGAAAFKREAPAVPLPRFYNPRVDDAVPEEWADDDDLGYVRVRADDRAGLLRARAHIAAARRFRRGLLPFAQSSMLPVLPAPPRRGGARGEDEGARSERAGGGGRGFPSADGALGGPGGGYGGYGGYGYGHGADEYESGYGPDGSLDPLSPFFPDEAEAAAAGSREPDKRGASAEAAGAGMGPPPYGANYSSGGSVAAGRGGPAGAGGSAAAADETGSAEGGAADEGWDGTGGEDGLIERLAHIGLGGSEEAAAAASSKVVAGSLAETVGPGPAAAAAPAPAAARAHAPSAAPAAAAGAGGREGKEEGGEAAIRSAWAALGSGSGGGSGAPPAAAVAGTAAASPPGAAAVLEGVSWLPSFLTAGLPAAFKPAHAHAAPAGAAGGAQQAPAAAAAPTTAAKLAGATPVGPGTGSAHGAWPGEAHGHHGGHATFASGAGAGRGEGELARRGEGGAHGGHARAAGGRAEADEYDVEEEDEEEGRSFDDGEGEEGGLDDDDDDDDLADEEEEGDDEEEEGEEMEGEEDDDERPRVELETDIDPLEQRAADALVLDSFNLKVIYRKDKTGFEEEKEFPLRINSVIAARYQVVEYLGSAAFSRAVQCYDMEEDRMVCIKIIKNNKDFFDQSIDEIKLLQLLNRADPLEQQPVLRLFDFFYHKEHLFIVCELLRDNLYEASKFNRESNNPRYFTLRRLRSVAQQCLRALKFIHSLQLIHCDLKPENILIKSYSRCEIKIIDYGSSCFTTDHLSSYVQSRSYRAPEVILGMPYDQGIDIWSLGCILAELWTGYVLFQNDSVTSMLCRMVSVLGPFDPKALARGRHSPKYFTADGLLHEKVRMPGSRVSQHTYLHPKMSSLRHRLRVDDELFLSFVGSTLMLDPEKRPTAEQCLQHPWIATDPYEGKLAPGEEEEEEEEEEYDEGEGVEGRH